MDQNIVSTFVMLAACPIHLVLLDLIIIIFAFESANYGHVLCNFLRLHVCFFRCKYLLKSVMVLDLGNGRYSHILLP